MNTEQFKFKDYKISVYVPNRTPPINGRPVLYILDGDFYFDLFVEKLREIESGEEIDKLPILVGVGYGSKEENSKERRFYDFTFKREKDVNTDLPEGGGILLFISNLEKLNEKINLKYETNKNKIGVFGHSLGGLAVLEMFCEDIKIFSHYMAVSPSIWWDNRAILEKFKVKKNKIGEKLYFAIGKKEGYLVKRAKELDQIFKENNLLEYPTDLKVVSGANHMTVVSKIAGDILNFFLK